MIESEFIHNSSGAQAFCEFSGIPDVYFWEGYRRGIRRDYFGERFGTPEEHALRMKPCRNSNDMQRDLRRTGYLAGFKGTCIADAIKSCKLAVTRWSR